MTAIAGSPRMAASAPSRTSSLSSAETASGSRSHGLSWDPRAGASGVSGLAAAPGWDSATSSARASAASSPLRVEIDSSFECTMRASE
ncbi:MAG: hypothetical protein H0W05_05995 [Thermoleophilaceae bacterium]|nr:hypothetical protein [Thermoleophilaceae bacterium]